MKEQYKFICKDSNSYYWIYNKRTNKAHRFMKKAFKDWLEQKADLIEVDGAKLTKAGSLRVDINKKRKPDEIEIPTSNSRLYIRLLGQQEIKNFEIKAKMLQLDIVKYGDGFLERAKNKEYVMYLPKTYKLYLKRGILGDDVIRGTDIVECDGIDCSEIRVVQGKIPRALRLKLNTSILVRIGGLYRSTNENELILENLDLRNLVVAEGTFTYSTIQTLILRNIRLDSLEVAKCIFGMVTINELIMENIEIGDSIKSIEYMFSMANIKRLVVNNVHLRSTPIRADMLYRANIEQLELNNQNLITKQALQKM